jgi:5-methylcytosine-specific restriction endonuclease McrA
VIQPLAPARYRVQFTLDEGGVALLNRAQALMRHRMPTGDVAAIVTEGLKLLVDRLEKAKTAATRRRRAVLRRSAARSRTMPAAVRRAVWARDEGRCAFVGTQGRCTETSLLEFHHVHPYAAGGGATVENVELRCRAHNQFEAEQYFGRSLAWTARDAAGVYDACPARSGPSSSVVISEAPQATVSSGFRSVSSIAANRTARRPCGRPYVG